MCRRIGLSSGHRDGVVERAARAEERRHLVVDLLLTERGIVRSAVSGVGPVRLAAQGALDPEVEPVAEAVERPQQARVVHRGQEELGDRRLPLLAAEMGPGVDLDRLATNSTPPGTSPWRPGRRPPRSCSCPWMRNVPRFA
jgi:hypothetical protein